MLEKIYEVIKNNKSVSFDEVHKQFSRQIKNKKDFSGYLKNLEEANKIFYYNQKYYDLSQFPSINGFINWNMTGFAWVTENHQSNDYGLSFDSNTELNSIYNKKRAFPGHAMTGRQITIDNVSFAYIETVAPVQDVKLIAAYKAKYKEWIILNCSPIFNIPNNQISNSSSKEVQDILNGAQEDEIVEFTYSKTGVLTLDKHYGNINKKGIETEIIKQLINIDDAPSLEEKITLPSLEKSNTPFYTIDSIYTKDIDDAIFCEKTNTGWKLQVAIADVSSFIKPNDKLDKHAQKTAISFYFPHEVKHLIDRKLSEDFCSLNPGLPKQSMICEIDINNDGTIANYTFKHQQIISKARLTYDDVDNLLEGNDVKESSYFNGQEIVKLKSFDEIPEIKKSLLELREMIKTQKFGRDRDYFVVETPDYELDSFGKISHLFIRDENQVSQKMVEIPMLLTNICAAKFIDENLNGLGMFRNQIEREEGEFPKPAQYSSDNNGHWGLDLTHYTHFTSPIRRYCDLVNHRLIKSIIYNESVSYSKDDIDNIAHSINGQQYIEKQVANKSKQLLLPQYIQRLQATNSLDKTLKIVDVTENGIVFQNSQLIEFFTPYFKVDNDLREISKTIALQNIDRFEKEKAISDLNKDYSATFEMSEFSWTDERKNTDIKIISNKPVVLEDMTDNQEQKKDNTLTLKPRM